MGNQQSEPVDFNQPVDLRHFELGRSIGKGGFGKVRIVQKKDTKKTYALKYINKAECIRRRAYRNIFRERNLLEKIEHPFIVNLRFAFQDDEYLFMALDLMLGGDLRFHLMHKKTFPDDLVVFYAAELCSALMYLHSRNIVHRDLKPDNILLDEQGHCHITDFNCACVLEDGKAVISETGTHGYMAPEVYETDAGYRESVDWWSLGITLYECLYGRRPFDEDDRDRLVHVLNTSEPEWDSRTRPDLKSLIEGFLTKSISRRLGCGPDGPREIQSLPIFKYINWDLLLQKKLSSPFQPDPNALNFDARYELEEILLEDNPLVAKARKLNRDTPNLSREMLLMEDEFKHFDYSIYERYTGIINPYKLSVGEPPSWVKCLDPPKPCKASNGSTDSGSVNDNSLDKGTAKLKFVDPACLPIQDSLPNSPAGSPQNSPVKESPIMAARQTKTKNIINNIPPSSNSSSSNYDTFVSTNTSSKLQSPGQHNMSSTNTVEVLGPNEEETQASDSTVEVSPSTPTTDLDAKRANLSSPQVTEV